MGAAFNVTSSGDDLELSATKSREAGTARSGPPIAMVEMVRVTFVVRPSCSPRITSIKEEVQAILSGDNTNFDDLVFAAAVWNADL